MNLEQFDRNVENARLRRQVAILEERLSKQETAPVAPERPTLLTTAECMKLLRLQRSKVYDLIHCGSLVGVKVGACWRIRRDSLVSMIGEYD